jgi:hypothetical protein
MGPQGIVVADWPMSTTERSAEIGVPTKLPGDG